MHMFSVVLKSGRNGCGQKIVGRIFGETERGENYKVRNSKF